MTVQLLRHAKPLAGIAALSFLVACSSDLTGGNRHPVQLSFNTKGGVSASTNVVTGDQVVGPPNELVLTRVQLVLRKIELDRDGTADCTAEVDDAFDDSENNGVNHDGNVDEECEEVFRGPLLIDLPVNGALVPVIQGLLASGTFTELEAKLKPAAGLLDGKSVRVEGTFKEAGASVATPFTFTSSVRAKLEMEFDPPLVVDATTQNATVSIDVGSWFLTSSGEVIDPRTATSGSTNLARIENNIRRSFHAFEDDHERGEDHHEGHGS